MDIFKEIKYRLSMPVIAEHYGIEIKHGGMCSCPFHNDGTPSMKIYDDSFYCFGCHEHGDIIGFVAKLFNLSNLESAKKIAHDFNLPLPLSGSPSNVAHEPQKRERTKSEIIGIYQHGIERYQKAYTWYLALLEQWKVEYCPKSPEEPFHPRYAEAVMSIDCTRYKLDTLVHGTEEERINLIIENIKEVETIEQFQQGISRDSISRNGAKNDCCT